MVATSMASVASVAVSFVDAVREEHVIGCFCYVCAMFVCASIVVVNAILSVRTVLVENAVDGVPRCACFASTSVVVVDICDVVLVDASVSASAVFGTFASLRAPFCLPMLYEFLTKSLLHFARHVWFAYATIASTSRCSLRDR